MNSKRPHGSNGPGGDASSPSFPAKEGSKNGANDASAQSQIGERISDPVEEAIALFEAGNRDFIREHLAREVLRQRHLLEEKDALIWSLNRDIGALEQLTSGDATDRSIQKWIAQAFGNLNRLLRSLRKSAPSEAKDDVLGEIDFLGQPQRDPLVPFGPENENKKIIAVNIFGLDREAIQKVLKTVARHCESRDAVPVILTDSVWAEDIREAGFAFEYVPSAELQEKLAPGRDWPMYLRRRMRLLRRKWAPDGFISFGAASPLDQA